MQIWSGIFACALTFPKMPGAKWLTQPLATGILQPSSSQLACAVNESAIAGCPFYTVLYCTWDSSYILSYILSSHVYVMMSVCNRRTMLSAGLKADLYEYSGKVCTSPLPTGSKIIIRNTSSNAYIIELVTK